MPESAVSSPACRRCGQEVSAQFSGSGLCATCAAASLLDRTLDDRGGFAPLPGAATMPEIIGAYRIIELLGRGGMGLVYLAQHRQLGRIVALKVIPLQSGAHALRFQREAQTAAALRHPHIVAVHDAGQDAQHFYFAMDYVEGGDLAARLRHWHPAPREAAVLMEKIVRAVAHSHAQGILHRDLKPSNILLDGDEPRVADFGLAAPLETGGDLTQHTTMLGTPHYLAPEALLKGSAAQDAASDVYSLGVILYELLCGRVPYTAATTAELQQLIVGGEPVAPHLLAPGLSRDLETICLKALAPEPPRRYASAAALAEDLRRYLAGEPITARPISATDRLWRWAKRRPQLAALWLLLCLLTVASTTAAWLVNRERKLAATEAAKALALADFLKGDLLAQASPDQQPERDLTVRALLDRAATRLDGRFPDDPATAAALRHTLGETYLALGENPAAEKQLRLALDLRNRALGPEHPETLRTVIALATTLNRLGQHDAASTLLAPAITTATQTLGPGDPLVIQARGAQVDIASTQGRLAEAERLARETWTLARAHLPPTDPAYQSALTNLAATLWATQKLSEAEPLNLEAVQLLVTTLGPEHPRTLTAKNNLATVYGSIGRYADAERLNQEVLAIRRRVLGPEHPETLRSLSNLAFATASLGRLDAAVAYYAELIAARRRTLGPAHADTFAAELAYSAILGRIPARRDEALAALSDTAARANAALGPQDPQALQIQRSLVNALLATRRGPEATAAATQYHELLSRLYGADDPRTLLAAESRARALGFSGDKAGAAAGWQKITTAREKSAPTHWRTAYASANWGLALAELGDTAAAEPRLRAAYAALQPADSGLIQPLRSVLPQVAAALATICRATGRPEEAAQWTVRAAPPAAP